MYKKGREFQIIFYLYGRKHAIGQCLQVPTPQSAGNSYNRHGCRGARGQYGLARDDNNELAVARTPYRARRDEAHGKQVQVLLGADYSKQNTARRYFV